MACCLFCICISHNCFFFLWTLRGVSTARQYFCTRCRFFAIVFFFCFFFSNLFGEKSCERSCDSPNGWTVELTAVTADPAISQASLAVRQRFLPRWSWNNPDTMRLTRISHVYAAERASATEGQNSKWPNESVTLGKSHPCVSGGSKMSAGSCCCLEFVKITPEW